jgi:BolA protein
MSITSTIQEKLETGLEPVHLEVINESDNHAVPPGSESHFKVVVVSARFDGQPTLRRHRMVYGLLAEEMAGPVHALALHTYTEEQWRELSASPCSPLCRGGSKKGAKNMASARPSRAATTSKV